MPLVEKNGSKIRARVAEAIPLGEAKQAAVEDGVAAYENLLSKLTDVPTPAGPTPRQIGAGFVQITSVRPALPASTPAESRSTGVGSREPDSRVRSLPVLQQVDRSQRRTRRRSLCRTPRRRRRWSARSCSRRP